MKHKINYIKESMIDMMKIISLLVDIFVITNGSIFDDVYTVEEWKWEAKKRVRLIDIIKSKYNRNHLVSRMFEVDLVDLRNVLYDGN